MATRWGSEWFLVWDQMSYKCNRGKVLSLVSASLTTGHSIRQIVQTDESYLRHWNSCFCGYDTATEPFLVSVWCKSYICVAKMSKTFRLNASSVASSYSLVVVLTKHITLFDSSYGFHHLYSFISEYDFQRCFPDSNSNMYQRSTWQEWLCSRVCLRSKLQLLPQFRSSYRFCGILWYHNIRQFRPGLLLQKDETLLAASYGCSLGIC